LLDFARKEEEDGMSKKKREPTLMECLEQVPDPRIERCRRHKLIDILFIAICAIICGADSFTEMEDFGEAKEAWLRRYLELPNGIPSHDTFRRVIGRLTPAAVEGCLLRWVRGVVPMTEGQIVPIDGKTVRRSHNKAAGAAAVELVSAWAQENRMTLGQVKVADDSNEITAVPELLRALEIKGCIVTVDALNTQKEIASEIRDREADYVLALKGNHATMRQEVADFLLAAQQGRTLNYEISKQQTVSGEHGRIETRTFWQVEAPDHLTGKAQWQDLRSVGMVEATREIKDHSSTEVRYYLSSMPVDIERFSDAVRGHWSIENSCHWILDVVFREDDCRVRVGHAAENFALLRRLALSLLSQEKTAKRGVKIKRFKAALDESYLLKILMV
jgi:predicted transposase YbfD/YdcC